MILGITGYAGSGKDTFAQPFIAAGWTQLRFADPLKAMLRAMLLDAAVYPPLIEEMLEGKFKEIPFTILGDKTPRFAMQTLGTEWRNLLHQDLWTRIMEKKLERLSGNKIITDLRFPHEAALLQTFGAFIIRIERAGKVETGHASERLINSISPNMTIQNNEGVADLHLEAQQVLNFLSLSTP